MSSLRQRLFVVLALFVLTSAYRSGAQLVNCRKSETQPTAVDDLASWPGGPIVIDVLGNDYDDDGDIVAITAFSQGASGTVQFSEDLEALVYTPSGTGAANDSFTYTISDGVLSDTATVRLTAAPVEAPPPPPAPARVWFDVHCNNLACLFTARWSGIGEVPRYFHWNWGNGNTTPPNYAGVSATSNFTPGTHSVELTVTFASGQQIASGPLPVVVEAPSVQCAFDAPASSGMQFSTRLTSLSSSGQPGFDAYDYFWDFDDGTGLHRVDSWSVFQVAGTTYRNPSLRTVNFVIKAGGAVVGQCPKLVQIVNLPPEPDFTAVPGNGTTTAPKLFTFTRTATDEWFGELGPWEWNFGDGSFTSIGGGIQTHYYARPGNYTVTLKVTDSLGAAGIIQKNITAPDEPPTISWVFNCKGSTCKFNASESSDDSEQLTYRWNFGDGSPVLSTTAPVAEHSFPADAAYDVTLTLDDGTSQVARTLRVTPRAQPRAAAMVFYALPPCRIVDSRNGTGGPLRGGISVNYTVAGVCGIPPEAKALAVNATVVSPTAEGELVLSPAGAAALYAAVNFSPARSPRANSFIVPVGTGGAISVFPVINASATTHVLLDVTGYFTDRLDGAAPARGPLRAGFWGPVRYYDTVSQPPSVAVGTSRNVRMRQSSPYGVSMDAEAAWVNVTAVNPTAAGWLSLYPSNTTTPATSNLNVQAGTSQANGAILLLGRRENDDLTVSYAGGPAGSSTGLTVDSSMWFAANATGRYYAVDPCRAVDTRQPGNGAPRLAQDGYRWFQIPGNCGVPYGAQQVILTARIVNPSAPGTAMIGSTTGYVIKQIPYSAGDTIANTVNVPSGGLYVAGEISCCSQNLEVRLFGGAADVVLDVIGYFLPEENALPVAMPDSASASLNVPVTIDVVANDTDGNADPLKLSTTRPIFNPPALGTATRASDRSITYTATSYGTDTFDYEIVDTRGGIAHGTVTVTVPNPNDIPHAVDDVASANIGVPITVNVLANDSHSGGQAIRLTANPIVNAPLLGHAVRASDTSITYTADTGGSDVLTYEIVDAAGATARARLTVAVNRPPVAAIDNVLLQSGTPITIDVLANDSDPDGNAVTLDDPPIVTPPASGSVTLNADGRRLDFTPGPSGSDSFKYAIIDGIGGRSVGGVVISLNRSPIAAADDVTLTNDGPADVTVTANDTDPDGDAVKLTANPFKPPLPAKGTVTRKNDTTFTYQPTAGSLGADTVIVELTDGRGGLATAPVNVTLHRRPIAVNDSATVNQDQSATINVVANDSDPDGDAVQLPAAAIKTPPAVGTASRATDTSITYSAANSGSATSTFFDYWLTDSRNATASARVNLVINRKPVAVADSITVINGTPVTFSVTANDTDPEGDVVKLTASPIVRAPALGTAVRASDTTITYTPNGVGTTSFDYQVIDARGAGPVTGTVNVTIQPANRPPVANADVATASAQNTAVDVNVVANDSDPDGDPLTVSFAGTSANGTAAIVSATTIRFTPGNGFAGKATFSYKVKDSKGAESAAATVTAQIPGEIVKIFTTGSDIPITGDWNGDGIDDPGVYRPSTRTWTLDGIPAFVWGNSQWDLPVVGDWNGDGKDDVGLFRDTVAQWFLRPDASTAFPGTMVTYGTQGWQPIVGDWNGDNIDDLGVFNPATATFSLQGQATFVFGAANDLPIAGDWNKDNRDDVGVYRLNAPSTGLATFLLRQPAGTTQTIVYGSSQDRPLAGDWAGTGRDSVGFVVAMSNTWRLNVGATGW